MQVRGATNDDAAVVRFNADGSLDGTFGGGIVTTHFNIDDVWNAVAVQPDGKICCGRRRQRPAWIRASMI